MLHHCPKQGSPLDGSRRAILREAKRPKGVLTATCYLLALSFHGVVLAIDGYRRATSHMQYYLKAGSANVQVLVPGEMVVPGCKMMHQEPQRLIRLALSDAEPKDKGNILSIWLQKHPLVCQSRESIL